MDKVSQASVDYRKGDDEKHCGNCVMFHARAHACDLVEGHIEPDCVCNKWEARKVSAEATTLAAVSMQARSLDIPTEKHPNKMPFSGVLTRIDEPSDAAPDGSNGSRVMITMEAAEKALDSLLGMAVDYQPNWDGHDPQAKIGVITGAEIGADSKGKVINVRGFIYAADFPEVAQQIKANKNALGMSFEARELMTTDPKADPIPIFDCVFTGAAILLKNKAAYKTTSISAQQGVNEGILDMDATELKQHLDAALKPLTEAIAAQATKIEALEQAPKIEAANHLAKVEKHANELEKAADHMDAAGIGGHPTRGHAAVLRDMAGDLRAAAAKGVLPATYDRFYATAADMQAAAAVDVKAEVEKAVAAVKTETEAQIAEVKAAAAKEVEDAKAAAETKIADVKAEAQRKAEEAANAPKRKSLAPSAMKLLAKAGVELPGDGAKLEIGKLDKAFAESGLTQDQRWSLKTALANMGAID